MPFSSEIFLSFFLPMTILCYFVATKSARNSILFLFSSLFFLWGGPKFLLVILILGSLNYFLGNILVQERRFHKHIFCLAITIHLSALIYYKYLAFFIGQLGGWISPNQSEFLKDLAPLLLPIGISFFTFEQISYISDVYMKKSKPAKSLQSYFLFLMLFPHSIAGPIFRWKDLEGQIESRIESGSDVIEGSIRFIKGLSKKILIANPLSIVADYAFSNINNIPTWLAWVGLFSYSFQIYYDFSGYSDMAIGLGRIFGFKFKENFQSPYSAISFTDFWRRWHISLSSWMRDYLYIPLGGNSSGSLRTIFNIFVVFLLSGFWHGANWTFIIWGAYNGFWILIERFTFWGRVITKIGDFKSRVLTFVLVSFGWVFFRSDSMGIALKYFASLFYLALPESEIVDPLAIFFPFSVQIIFCFTFFVWIIKNVFLFNLDSFHVGFRKTTPVLYVLVLVLLTTITWASLVNSNFNPFIYFRF